MARLLVTGGAGFIGTNFVHYWLREHPADFVVVLDALTYAGNLANLDPVSELANFRFVHGNICDTPLVEDLLHDHKLDVIVHFAAESHVDRSISGPNAFIESNVIGTHSLLTAARRVWLEEKSVPRHHFHHVSTDEVYGSLGPDDPPFSETTPYAPNSPYSASKAASDHLVRAYHHTYGLATTISNCSNNYGPYQFAEKLIPLIITRILHGEALPVYGDGRNVRDWLHVEDHCRAIELILAGGKKGDTYNVGGQSEYENIAIVHELCEALDQKFQAAPALRQRFPNSPCGAGAGGRSLISFVTDRLGHDRRYAINCGKIESELGFQPRHTLSEALRATVDWYLTRLSSP
jgi:dTDP-glucose 4,6-dehydratase